MLYKKFEYVYLIENSLNIYACLKWSKYKTKYSAVENIGIFSVMCSRLEQARVKFWDIETL
jgi:hypothetical protein